MNFPQDPQTSPQNNLAHAFALYEKARALSTHVKPLDTNTAKIIVETASDAIKEFGNTSQEKKIELRRMIEEAEDVLPSATVEELRKRAEGKAIRILHPKGPRLRKVFYVLVLLLLLAVPAALFLTQIFKSPRDSAYATPTPTPMIARVVETPPEFKPTPTPTQTPPVSEPSGAEVTASRPAPGPPALRNTIAQWSRLTTYTEWRVTGVQSLENATRLSIEVRNIHAQSEEYFYAFASHPLVIIDGKGGFHKMLWTSEAPEGVREDNKMWYLQAGRVIEVTATFAPLDHDTTTGQVVYEIDNRAEPAKFSISVVKGIAQ